MSCVNREQLRKDLLLYAVTDRSWLGNETLYEQVEKALKGGATFIQLREKELDEEHFMEEAVALKELCHKYHVLPFPSAGTGPLFTLSAAGPVCYNGCNMTKGKGGGTHAL